MACGGGGGMYWQCNITLSDADTRLNTGQHKPLFVRQFLQSPWTGCWSQSSNGDKYLHTKHIHQDQDQDQLSLPIFHPTRLCIATGPVQQQLTARYWPRSQWPGQYLQHCRPWSVVTNWHHGSQLVRHNCRMSTTIFDCKICNEPSF